MYVYKLVILLMLFIIDTAVAENDSRFRTVLPYGDVLEDGKVLPKDHYMGDLDAPIVMIEYASFSCIHCANFSKKVLPVIKEKYIDTGKLLFVFREFPLDAPALKASVVARCYASDKYCDDESCDDGNCCDTHYDYFAMYQALFSSISNWSGTKNYMDKLKEVVSLGKMQPDRFYKCVKDKYIQEQIMNGKIYAIRSLGINVAPVFLINGKKYEGDRNANFFTDTFDKIIEAYYAEQ